MSTQFKNAKEQFIHYFNKFIHFYVKIGRELKLKSMPDEGKIDEVMKSLGDDFLIAKTSEIYHKHQEGLKAKSLPVVSKIVSEFSNGMTVIEEMKQVTDYLDSNETMKKHFFSYWNILAKIQDVENSRSSSSSS